MGSRKRIRTHSHLKKILWLSWRDIKNPDSGGAEKVAIEVASRFVKDQIPVTIFSSRFPNAKKQEKIRGVKVIRRGGLVTCRFFAFLYYIRRTREFDLIIDEINTIPFFSIFYAKKKTVVLIHQLAKEYWFSQTFWPINLVGYYLESFFLRPYRKLSTITVSESTKKDLIKFGFTNIKVVREGLDFKPQIITTSKKDLILFIGRLIAAKGPQDAIRAFEIIKSEFPTAKLSIIGKGSLRFINSLKKLIKELSLGKSIDLKGFITQKTKINLLKKAKVILIPSVREGWGLVATEANALGCVPVAYNAPGLRDSIKNGETGLLAPANPQALAKTSLRLLKNEALWTKLSQTGYNWAKKISWENCYKDFSNLVSSYHKE